jgi:hypothetical protein
MKDSGNYVPKQGKREYFIEVKGDSFGCPDVPQQDDCVLSRIQMCST